MNTTWNLTQRQQILTDYATAKERLENLLWIEAVGNQVDIDEMDHLQDQVSDLWDAYEAAVPFLPIARCPFTDQVVQHSCDNAGLDGLWWQYEPPVRPEENLPPTFFELTGAVAITPPPETTSFLCKPGPGMPYVLPQLLSQPPVKAVLRSFPVGRHTAYAVTYFVELPGLPLVRPNAWGSSFYSWINENGEWHWGEANEDEEVWDFDLLPWLDNGKLLWIAPDDTTLRLQSGPAGCPYIGLAGERRMQYIQFGEVTTW